MNNSKVRVPQQKRSKEQVEKLKQAAFSLFSTEGYFNTSSNKIAKEAKVSIGTFYSYYKDKKQIFIELLHDYNKKVVEQLPNILPQKSICKRELINLYISRVCEAHSYFIGFHREMVILVQSDIEVKQVMDFYENKMIEKIAALLKQYVSDPKNIYEKAYYIFRTTESIVHDIKIFGCRVDDKKLLEEHASMLFNYIN